MEETTALRVHTMYMQGGPEVTSEEYVRPARTLQRLDELVAGLDRSRPVCPSVAGGERLLVVWGALSVVNRVDDVFALLKAGTGATIVGALCRSLLEQALRARRVAADPTRYSAPMALLARERGRLVADIVAGGSSVPNLDRWLRPTPEDGVARTAPGAGPPDLQQDLSGRAGSAVESILGMPSAVADLLAMCGHANYAASMCTVLPPPHAVGFEATPAHAALFAHAAGAAAVEAGRLWGAQNLDGYADRLAAASRSVHMLPAPTVSDGTVALMADERLTCHTSPEWLPTQPIHDALLDEVLAETTHFLLLLRQAPNPFSGDPAIPINLTGALPYLTALGTCEAAIQACHGHYSGATAATAARMLLEEGARQLWQANSVDLSEIKARYVAVADAATQGRLMLRQRLAAAGTTPQALASLFDTLPNADSLAIDRRRTPPNQRARRPPRPAEQMAELGLLFAEPAWCKLAFSLLSQVVHATPLGDMHSRLDTRMDSLRS